MIIVSTILDLFESLGCEKYPCGLISVREHSLQAAARAEREGAAAPLVLAALLHDIGYLLVRVCPRDGVQYEVDRRHEQVGAGWLEPFFGPAISEPVRLHVEAKRYLCAVEPGYGRQLSAASRERLAMQGGPLTRAEIRDFQEHPYHRAAVWLCRIDDRACVADGTEVPGFEHYRERLEAALLWRQLALESARRKGICVAPGYREVG